jgi:hypothetical protein
MITWKETELAGIIQAQNHSLTRPVGGWILKEIKLYAKA